ncbi:SIS domain-containing protein [Mycolicibacterium arenosum]|uniref:Phosphoheptose isomerase n=1 Tax=Mycolicibacterium arenosum TaxID=2952157 RepID=A0ABT1MAL2_9MYCO|nr:SIS domain-containing protein [Mycolicibacterium sp. CAU 1645]MCP9275279.1 SIS domain-containing protein [Mycolicibacterium sp. CAU 1645]
MVATVSLDVAKFISAEIDKSRAAIDALDSTANKQLLRSIADRIVDSIAAGGKIMFCGNGGSAADAQHLAAELVGRQNYNRSAAAGLALTVDTSALTAIGNDYGFDRVFSRQVEALGRYGDVLIGISTSGRSQNIVRAFEVAHDRGILTIAFTGAESRDMGCADIQLEVPATETAKIQELHITCGHIVFALVERILFPADPAP